MNTKNALALRKLPVVGHPFTLRDLGRAFMALGSRSAMDEFSRKLMVFFGVPCVYLTGSGNAAFCVILEALKNCSEKNEIILPCYTAPSLVVAIRQSGLKPVLCDISLSDFNIDLGDLKRRMNNNTLAILGVHMFGIPWEGIVDLKKDLPRGIFLIEDCAQAFGAKINNVFAGIFGDMSFFSFNRGKNLPTVEGGSIVVNSCDWEDKIAGEFRNLKSASVLQQGINFVKFLAMFLAFNPYVYGALYPLIAHFKDTSVPLEIPKKVYTMWQAALGESLLENSDDSFSRRRQNGCKLITALKNNTDIMIPCISDRIQPVFNRLPILFKDSAKVALVIDALEKAGIESSRLYGQPLHHIFDLGYEKEEFPNAVYLAERLLTLPVHPLVTDRDIEVMVKVIRETVENG